MLSRASIDNLIATLQQAEVMAKTILTLAEQTDNKPLAALVASEPGRIQISIKILKDHLSDMEERGSSRQLLIDHAIKPNKH